MFRIVAPKKAKVDEAMASLHEKQNILAEARRKLNELMMLMEELKQAYNEKLAQKEELRIRVSILILASVQIALSKNLRLQLAFFFNYSDPIACLKN